MPARHGKEPLVTVVIPVYKTERYLEECLESVTGQTWKKLEILLVEDGSPDRCPEICDRWAEKDRRIRVIHKANAGLGMARNTGMEQAGGEYLCFVDSDDCLMPEAIARALEEQAEAAVYGFQDISPEGKVLKKLAPRTKQTRFSGEEVQKIFLPMLLSGQQGLHPGVCWGLFSMEAVNRAQWRFPSEREIICEDIYGLLRLYGYVKDVAVIPQALYCYRKGENTLSRHYREDRFEKAKDFYEKSRSLCEKMGYPQAVAEGCREPFLALAITAMKQARGEALQKMLEDDLWKKTVREERGKTWKRKLFFWAAGRGKYRMCRFLLTMGKNRETGRKFGSLSGKFGRIF